MEDQEILLKKCQKFGLKVSFKTHKHTLKRKIIHLERDVEELMSPDDLQGIVCCYIATL